MDSREHLRTGLIKLGMAYAFRQEMERRLQKEAGLLPMAAGAYGLNKLWQGAKGLYQGYQQAREAIAPGQIESRVSQGIQQGAEGIMKKYKPWLIGGGLALGGTALASLASALGGRGGQQAPQPQAARPMYRQGFFG